jgi:hypothetical protein
MTLTCTVAAVGYAIALALVLHGLIVIASRIDAPIACRACLAAGAVETTGGVVIWAGMLAMTAGYL